MCKRKKAEAEIVDKPRHRMRKLLKVALIVGIVTWYVRLEPSKKRFFNELLKHAPDLPGRYYA